MARFLFVSRDAESIDLAIRLAAQGHRVRYYTEQRVCQKIGDGFPGLEKVALWRVHLGWADCVVTDDNNFGKDLDAVRKIGKPVFGGSAYTDKMENDRAFFMHEVDTLGLKRPRSWEVSSIKEAMQFVESHRIPVAVKPEGTKHEDRTGTFVGKPHLQGQDVIAWLKTTARHAPNRTPFLIQEVIQGIELGVETFFDGTRFTTPLNLSFEHKRFGAGNTGHLTGEMGTTMFYTEDLGKAYRETLAPFEQKLREANFRGDIAIGTIVNAEGTWILEATGRFGYPEIFIQAGEMITTPLHEWILQVARGSFPRVGVKRGWGIGVRVVLKSYPFEPQDHPQARGVVVGGITRELMPHLHPEEMKIEDGEFLHEGCVGEVLTVTAHGDTLPEARQLVTEHLQQLAIPDAYWRVDIGATWPQDYPRLKAWGYL